MGNAGALHLTCQASDEPLPVVIGTLAVTPRKDVDSATDSTDPPPGWKRNDVSHSSSFGRELRPAPPGPSGRRSAVLAQGRRTAFGGLPVCLRREGYLVNYNCVPAYHRQGD